MIAVARDRLVGEVCERRVENRVVLRRGVGGARGADTPPQDDPALDAALAYLADQPVAGDGDRSPQPSGSPSAALDAASVVGVVALQPIC